MVSVVPNRFAGLKIEDDDEEPQQRVQKQPKPSNNVKKESTKPKAKKNKKQKKPKPAENGSSNHEWETYNEESAAAAFERDLREALLASQLEYEAQIVNDKNAAKEQSQKAQTKNNNKNSSNKLKPMNLQEFHKLSNGEHKKEPEPASEPLTNGNKKDKDFFDKIDAETKNILKKDATNSTPKPKVKSPIPSKKVEPKIEEKEESPVEKELQTLREENTILKSTIEDLQNKLRKATNIVKDAELKEKITLMRENEKLKKSHDDLAALVENLAVELSQEKSKVSQMVAHGGAGGASGGGGKNGILRKNVRFDAYPEVLHYYSAED